MRIHALCISKVPWRIPAEFAHFQDTSDGHVVVLGCVRLLLRQIRDGDGRLRRDVAVSLGTSAPSDGALVPMRAYAQAVHI